MTDLPTTGARAGRGRRAGRTATRDEILRHALDQFAEQGYADTSVRGIAAAAGVDPSLVTHFYRSKQALFVEAIGLLGDLPERGQAMVTAGRQGLGRRLADTYLRLWEDPHAGPRLRALFRSVTTNKAAAQAVQSVLEARVLSAAAENLSPEVVARFPLAMTQLAGVAIAKYVLEVRPLAAMSREELVDALTPALEATLGA